MKCNWNEILGLIRRFSAGAWTVWKKCGYKVMWLHVFKTQFRVDWSVECLLRAVFFMVFLPLLLQHICVISLWLHPWFVKKRWFIKVQGCVFYIASNKSINILFSCMNYEICYLNVTCSNISSIYTLECEKMWLQTFHFLFFFISYVNLDIVICQIL